MLVLTAQSAIALEMAPAAHAATLSGYQLPWRGGLAHAIRGSWYGEAGHQGSERYGLDWNLWYESVLATKAGTVVVAATGARDPGPKACRSRTGTGFGNYVVIDHHDGVRSLYGHLSRVTVRTGQRVRIGQVIGVSGNTGRSCGPHLHFRLTRNGVPIKPEPMGGFPVFPHNHARLFAGRNALFGPLPPVDLPPAPVGKTPPPKKKPRPDKHPLPPPPPVRHEQPNFEITRAISAQASTFTAREPVTFNYQIRNAGKEFQPVALFGVRVRAPGDEVFMLPCNNGENRLLSPARTFTCSLFQDMEREGTYSARAVWLDASGEWHRLGDSTTFEMRRPHLDVVDPTHMIASGALVPGVNATFPFSVRNPAAVSVDVGRIYVRIWRPDGSTQELPCDGGQNFVLAPTQLFACAPITTLASSGSYQYRANWYDTVGRSHPDEIGEKQSFSVAERPRAALTVHIDGPGSIAFSSISCNSECRKTYQVPSTVTLDPHPRRRATFVGWTGACTGTERCVLSLTEDTFVGARFEYPSEHPPSPTPTATPTPSASPTPSATPTPAPSPSASPTPSPSPTP